MTILFPVTRWRRDQHRCRSAWDRGWCCLNLLRYDGDSDDDSDDDSDGDGDNNDDNEGTEAGDAGGAEADRGQLSGRAEDGGGETDDER